jgi:hypothetical protein
VIGALQEKDKELSLIQFLSHPGVHGCPPAFLQTMEVVDFALLVSSPFMPAGHCQNFIWPSLNKA